MTATGYTIVRAATVRGLGLFTETNCRVTIAPAESGLTMRRSGASAPVTIEHLSAEPVHTAFRSMPPRNTNLTLDDGSVVFTVEHILSALAGLGVVAAIIEIEGQEMPIGDGSARAFVEAIRSAGLVACASRPSTPTEGFTVGDPAGAHIRVTPAQRSTYIYHLDYGPESPIRPQSASWDGTAEAYARQVAPARTYCLDSEARAMQSAGLFRSFSPRDMLVIGPEGPIDNALRFDDEPARHKLLDLIGDLALAGLPLPPLAVEAFGSGHALNHEAARLLRRAAASRGTVSP